MATSVLAVTLGVLSATAQTRPVPGPLAKTPGKTQAIPKKTAAEKEAELKKQRALDLVQRSHAIDTELNGMALLDVLYPQILAAAWLGERPLAARWAHELFDLGPTLEPKLGARAQLAAITAVAKADAADAVSLLERVEPAYLLPPANQLQGEDQPQTSTMVIALGEYARQNGKTAMPKVLAVASTLGDRGRYPYNAIIRASHVLKDPPTDERTTTLLLTRFQQRIDPPGAAFEFASMLIYAKDFWPKETLKLAVEAAVDGIVSYPVDDVSRNFELTLKTAKGAAALNGPIEIGLLRLMPLIISVSPKRAEQLHQAYPNLANPIVVEMDPKDNATLMSFRPSKTPSTNAKVQRREAIDEYREMASVDPDKAAKAIAAIPDASLRADTAAEVAQDMLDQDPAKAAQFSVIAEQGASAIDDSMRKFQALCARLQMDAVNKQRAAVVEELDAAFRMGDKLLRKAHEDGEETHEITSYLEAAVGETIKLEPDLTSAQIETVYLPYDRARLLIVAAHGLTPVPD